ncbi:MAG: PilN domain-containing protein [Bryobacteraceae bacterium]
MIDPLRNWIRIGSGVGIEFDGADVLVTAVRIRFERVIIRGELRIANYATRPAAEWGYEYTAFLKRLELHHLAAYVLLPRESATVRVLSLPPIKSSEMDSAVRYQTESLHPYAEDEAAYSWTRLAKPTDVLVAITRRETVDHLSALFAEAGISVACFTVTAAALYSAVRFIKAPAEPEFAAIESAAGGMEVYGESRSRAVFSAFENGPVSRMEILTRAELRLDPSLAFTPLRALLPTVDGSTGELDGSEYQSSRCYAAALCAAVPMLALRVNLLPKELRDTSSRLLFVPTVVLAAVLVGCLVALALEGRWEQMNYSEKLQAQIKQLEPAAQQARLLEGRTRKAAAETQEIDSFRLRSKADLDVLDQVSRILAPPGFLSSLDLTRSNAQLAGEAPSAVGLLRALDASPYFHNSSFMQTIGRTKDGEAFHVRADRQGTP